MQYSRMRVRLPEVLDETKLNRRICINIMLSNIALYGIVKYKATLNAIALLQSSTPML